MTNRFQTSIFKVYFSNVDLSKVNFSKRFMYPGYATSRLLSCTFIETPSLSLSQIMNYQILPPNFWTCIDITFFWHLIQNPSSKELVLTNTENCSYLNHFVSYETYLGQRLCTELIKIEITRFFVVFLSSFCFYHLYLSIFIFILSYFNLGGSILFLM